jgi:G3E family GTPase
VNDLLQAINRTSEIIECEQAKVDLQKIMGLCSFDLEKILSMDPEFLKASSFACAISPVWMHEHSTPVMAHKVACCGGIGGVAPAVLHQLACKPLCATWHPMVCQPVSGRATSQSPWR